MNEQGNVMRAMVGGLIFILGMIVLMTLWSPLMIYLLPLLQNTETIAMGDLVASMILLIPAIVTFVGIAILASEAYGGIRGQQQ